MEQVLNYNAYYKHKAQPKISVDTNPIIKNATYLQDQSDPRGITKTSGFHIITEHVMPQEQKLVHLQGDTAHEHAPRKQGQDLTVNMYKYDRSKDSVNNILH
tara:strand:+ start:1569 stop:1874 length:306 start_codon:yes stop_codon:yes gene_type:complete